MVKLLINNGANVHSRTEIPHKSPIQLAAAGGHLSVMEELVKRGINWKEKDDWGWNLLHEVAATGNAETIRWVSTRSKGLSNVTDKLGRTPLLTALIAGAGVEAVAELLKQGEDPGEEDEVGRTTTEAAVLYCSSEVVKIILEAAKKDDEIEFDKKRLLLIAEDHAEASIVKKIIENALR